MTVIFFGNHKGGVGKSSLTEVMAYIYSEHKKYKVLAIDTDPQTNLTDKISKTFKKDISDLPQEEDRFMGAIEQADLTKAIINITDNLDLMVGDWHLERFHDSISGLDKQARFYLLHTLLKDIADDYDYVFIDTRPSTDLMMNNVVCASDYGIIASKSEEDSFMSSVKYIEYLKRMTEYNPELNLIGIVNYLVNPRGYVDNEIMARFKAEFDTLVFDNKIKSSEVVKRWGLYGITENRPYDKKIMQMYYAVADELNERIKELEE
ncbi:ParA family protein [Salinicoccus jeotgali]|uniref:ParA family protein n=1 Tax=Salinicoccus jeotgali TaxID=381634 RepID=A0ABP7E4L3_9STAP